MSTFGWNAFDSTQRLHKLLSTVNTKKVIVQQNFISRGEYITLGGIEPIPTEN